MKCSDVVRTRRAWPASWTGANKPSTLGSIDSEMQKEIAGFVSERIRQDMESQQELLRCRTLDEVHEVQSRFFRTAMDQYSSEATKLMQLGTELLTRSIERRDNGGSLRGT